MAAICLRRQPRSVQARLVDMIGGYRLVRKLGAGSRAELFLGHAGAAEDESDARTVAIKLFRPDVDQASVDAEISALTQASSPHLLELRDIASAPDGRPCLVLPRLGQGSLARLLLDRGTLQQGEAVTALAPLVSAIESLHNAGISHGRIHAGSVLFGRTGAPVLTGFGHASLLSAQAPDRWVPTPAQLAEAPSVAEDLEQLGAMTASVLSCVRGGAAGGAETELLDWIRARDPREAPLGYAAELRERLFELAEPLPIDFGRLSESKAESIPARGTAARASGVRQGTVTAPAPVPHTRPRLLRWLANRAATQLEHAHRASQSLSRLRAMLARVRKPYWIVGALGLSALVFAVAALPSTGNADAVTPRPSGTAESSHPNAATGSAPAPHVTGAAIAAIGADDPVAAATALLVQREHCFDALSVLCLEDVDQVGSAALDSDRTLIRSLQEGGVTARTTSLAAAQVTLTQRLGDSALMSIRVDSAAVSANDPASLLLVKGEAGWRIRDVLFAQS